MRSISGLNRPVSSGFVIIRPAVRSDSAARTASSVGRPFASGYSVTSRKPAVAGPAPSHGWEKTVVMISSRCASPRARW
jgi:hypothetical protein